MPLESAVAEEAARVAEDEDIARVDALLGEAEATPLSWDGRIALDRQFHIGVTPTLGNAVLVRCVGDLFDQRINPYYERVAHHLESPATWRAAHEEHRAVRDAIDGHDPQRARAAMREHLERSRERFALDLGEAPDSQPDPRGQYASRYSGRRKNARPSASKGTPPRQRAAGNARTQLE